ncbi:hypothetical protein LAX30_23080, partial [Escherichia coli]|nr:hypothetical protein [Escherichia coli]
MISMTKADLRLAVQRLISSSIVMLMSVISTHYDLSRISVGHYIWKKINITEKPMRLYLMLFILQILQR